RARRRRSADRTGVAQPARRVRRGPGAGRLPAGRPAPGRQHPYGARPGALHRRLGGRGGTRRPGRTGRLRADRSAAAGARIVTTGPGRVAAASEGVRGDQVVVVGTGALARSVCGALAAGLIDAAAPRSATVTVMARNGGAATDLARASQLRATVHATAVRF